MGKNKLYQPENQFPQAGIATLEFQKLQESSELKKILFLFSLAGMKNSLRKKRFHLTEKLFPQAGISAKWKKLQPEKLFLLGVKKFF